MVASTIAWVSYALAVGNPWIAGTNIPGMIVAFYQLVTMLPLMKPGSELTQFQGVILSGVTAQALLFAGLLFGGVSPAARSQVLGQYATAICIILFASPLSTIATVLKTKDSASILAPLTAAQCANWCATSRAPPNHTMPCLVTRRSTPSEMRSPHSNAGNAWACSPAQLPLDHVWHDASFRRGPLRLGSQRHRISSRIAPARPQSDLPFEGGLREASGGVAIATETGRKQEVSCRYSFGMRYTSSCHQ